MTDRTRRDSQGSATTPIKGILPVLMLAVFTISVGFGIVLPQLPALIERLLGADATPAQIARATGLLTAIYMLALFICAPLWGWLSDHWGRRRVLLIGLAGAAAKMAVTKMILHGWLQEVDANLRRGEPLWRESGDGHGTTLVVTNAGLLAIGIEPVVAQTIDAIREHAADTPKTSCQPSARGPSRRC